MIMSAQAARIHFQVEVVISAVAGHPVATIQEVVLTLVVLRIQAEVLAAVNDDKPKAEIHRNGFDAQRPHLS
jgi:hypothetical protein